MGAEIVYQVEGLLMHLALSAGESSGDQLAASTARAVLRQEPHLRLCGLAGQAMRHAGVEPLASIDQLGVMGLFEVVGHLPRLAALRARLRDQILARRCDAFVGFDAPDFNLGLARALRRRGMPTVQVVAPTVWAWRRYRIGRIARSVDLLLTLFPFEPDHFRGHGIPVRYIGHPMADAMPLKPDRRAALLQLGLEVVPGRPVVALLPGSREGEIRRHARLLVEAVIELRRRMDFEPLLLLAEASHAGLFDREAGLPAHEAGLTTRIGSTREGLAAADLALAASGTVTLEALLSHTPMVMFYRLAPSTYRLVRWLRLVRSRWIALPNILADRELVPERIQYQATPRRLAADAVAWLDNPGRQEDYVRSAQAIHARLACNAADNAAGAILELAGGAASGPST